MINESFLRESMECEQIITGQEVADMVGMGDVYRRGKEMEAQDAQMVEKLKGNFASIVERMNKVPSGIDKDFE